MILAELVKRVDGTHGEWPGIQMVKMVSTMDVYNPAIAILALCLFDFVG